MQALLMGLTQCNIFVHHDGALKNAQPAYSTGLRAVFQIPGCWADSDTQAEFLLTSVLFLINFPHTCQVELFSQIY